MRIPQVFTLIHKAPACESRGFVRKKEGVLFDTPSKSKIVRLIGLEPTRQRHQILSLARLPITPQAL